MCFDYHTAGNATQASMASKANITFPYFNNYGNGNNDAVLYIGMVHELSGRFLVVITL